MSSRAAISLAIVSKAVKFEWSEDRFEMQNCESIYRCLNHCVIDSKSTMLIYFRLILMFENHLIRINLMSFQIHHQVHKSKCCLRHLHLSMSIVNLWKLIFVEVGLHTYAFLCWQFYMARWCIRLGWKLLGWELWNLQDTSEIGCNRITYNLTLCILSAHWKRY